MHSRPDHNFLPSSWLSAVLDLSLSTTMPSTQRFPTCVCGQPQCTEVRRKLYERRDPLRRFECRSVSFAGGRPGRKKGKTDIRKQIYEECFDKALEYGEKYQLAFLHFPPPHLAYCQRLRFERQGTNQRTLPSAMVSHADMVSGGLRQFAVDKYRGKDHKGNAVYFIPPCVSAQEVQYALAAEEAVAALRRDGIADDVSPGDANVFGKNYWEMEEESLGSGDSQRDAQTHEGAVEVPDHLVIGLRPGGGPLSLCELQEQKQGRHASVRLDSPRIASGPQEFPSLTRMGEAPPPLQEGHQVSSEPNNHQTAILAHQQAVQTEPQVPPSASAQVPRLSVEDMRWFDNFWSRTYI